MIWMHIFLLFSSLNVFSFEYKYSRACHAAQHDQWEKAQEQLSQLVIDAPNRADLLYDLGVTLFHSGDFSKAYAYFAQAGKQDAPSELRQQAWFNAGNCSVELNKLEQAMANYDEVLALNSNHEPAKHNRKKVEEMLKKQQQEEKNKNQQKQDKSQQQSGNSGNNDKNNGESNNQEKSDDNSNKGNDQPDSNKKKNKKNNDSSNDMNKNQKNESSESDNDDSSKEQKEKSSGNSRQNDQRGNDKGKNKEDRKTNEEQKQSGNDEQSMKDKLHNANNNERKEQGKKDHNKSKSEKKLNSPNDTQKEEKGQTKGFGDQTERAYFDQEGETQFGENEQWMAHLLQEKENDDQKVNKQIIKSIVDKKLVGSPGQRCW